jgi:hypothetical protein
MAMDRGCYNAAINEISTSADENFSFGGILNTGYSFALLMFSSDFCMTGHVHPRYIAGWVR